MESNTVDGKLGVSQDALFSLLNLFPIPMEAFSPDGVCLFMNKEFIEFFRIQNPLDIMGKFNVFHDSSIMQRLGLTDYIKRVFSGEILSVCDVKVPFEGQEMYQDITSFPLLHPDGTVAYVITVFITKRAYQWRLDTIRAKEYIDTH
ncbi:MAG: hypothetical protein WCX60_04495, partial [Anaerovoracaceae bacterium]